MLHWSGTDILLEQNNRMGQTQNASVQLSQAVKSKVFFLLKYNLYKSDLYAVCDTKHPPVYVFKHLYM